MDAEQIYQEWLNELPPAQRELAQLDIDEDTALYDNDSGLWLFLEIPAGISDRARDEFYQDEDDFCVRIPEPPRRYYDRLYLEQRRVVITPVERVYCACGHCEHVEGERGQQRMYHTGCHDCGEQAYNVDSADHDNLHYGYGCFTPGCEGEIVSQVVEIDGAV